MASTPKYILLSELNALVKHHLNPLRSLRLWVMAEITTIKASGSGHTYLELVEKSGNQLVAKTQAVIWHGNMTAIRRLFGTDTSHILKQGNTVLFRCQLTYHEVYGMKLNISEIDPSVTLGRLESQRLEIIQRFQQEALLDLNKQRLLPPVIQKIAVISSPTAAGYGDFVAHIKQNPWGYRIQHTLYEASMQGEQVEKDVTTQLKVIAHHKERYDAVIIIRGGGSKLDLQYFNNYEIGKAIAHFPLPVLIGIGHQQDQSTTDLVAYQSLKTPTAVAEYIIHSFINFESRLLEFFETIKHNSQYQLQQAMLHVQQLKSTVFYESKKNMQQHHGQLALLKVNLKQLSKQHLLNAQTQFKQLSHAYLGLRHQVKNNIQKENYQLHALQLKLKNSSLFQLQTQQLLLHVHTQQIKQLVKYRFQQEQQQLQQWHQAFQWTEIQRLLTRGFSITRKNGTVIKSTNEIQKGDLLQIELKNGSIQVKVI